MAITQIPCLKNPMGRRARQATVQRVTQEWTRSACILQTTTLRYTQSLLRKSVHLSASCLRAGIMGEDDSKLGNLLPGSQSSLCSFV